MLTPRSPLFLTEGPGRVANSDAASLRGWDRNSNEASGV